MRRAKSLPTPDKLSCRNCKRVFEATGQYKKVSKREGPCSRFGCLEDPACADGCVWVICRDLPSCRARVLASALGIDLFTQYPRERLLYEMDVRPANYKKTGWKPIFSEDQRVMAGWLYYSWCYPVCMRYAVQINADDEIMCDRWGQPMVMTQERLGEIIGLAKPNICRSTNKLDDRKELQIDDGSVYPTPKPQISPEERKVISTDNLTNLGDDPNTIPLKYRRTLDDLLDELPEVLRTDNLARAVAFCTDYNEGHKVLRTTRDDGIEHICIEIATLLSRLPPTFKKRRAGIFTTPASGPPAPNRPVDGEGGIPVKELYTPLAADSLDEEDRQLLAEADPADRPELEAYLLEDTAESHRQDVEDAENQRRFLAQTDAQTARMRARGELGRVPPPAGPTPAQVLYFGIPDLQKQFPHAPFATPEFSALGKPDKLLTQRILDALEGEEWNRQPGRQRTKTPADVEQFLGWIKWRFGTGARNPASVHKVALFVELAKEWAAEEPARQKAAEAERQWEAREREREAEQRTELEADAALEAQVEDCWEQMPIAEKMKRLKATRNELKTEKRWHNMTESMRTSEVERCAKGKLKSEIQNAPEIGQGATGDD